MKRVMMACCLMLLSCSNTLHKSSHISLLWENYTTGLEDPEHVEWYLNGEYVGNGLKVFNGILVRIQNVNTSSILFIENEPFVEKPSSFLYMPPFQECFEEFVNILLERHIIVKRNGYKGSFSTREDIEKVLNGVIRGSQN